MKYTEGAFRDWGYNIAKEEFGAKDLDGGPWQEINIENRKIIIKDVIARICCFVLKEKAIG